MTATTTAAIAAWTKPWALHSAIRFAYLSLLDGDEGITLGSAMIYPECDAE